VTWQIVTLSYWYCAAVIEFPAKPIPPITPNATGMTPAKIAAKSARCALECVYGSVGESPHRPPLLRLENRAEGGGQRKGV
jgi:hypothetical protein